MNRLEFGTLLSPSDVGARASNAPKSLKAYGNLASSTILRRSGKAGGLASHLRSDQAATLLSARRKLEAEDCLGRELAEFYQAMLSQPVPERLLALVEALEAKHPR